MIRAAVVLVAGCAQSYQSARVVAPGKTQITGALSRTESISEDDDDGAIYSGDVQVRQGVSDRFDLGLRLVRTPGAGEVLSQLGVDPKVQITAPDSTTTLTVALPISVAWAEEGDEWGEGVLVLTPTVFVGIDLSPAAELVMAPKVFVFLPDGKTDDSEVEVGGSIGVRFSDASKTWAIQPELGLLHISEGDDGASFLTFGLGVSAGN